MLSNQHNSLTPVNTNIQNIIDFSSIAATSNGYTIANSNGANTFDQQAYNIPLSSSNGITNSLNVITNGSSQSGTHNPNFFSISQHAANTFQSQ